MARIVTCLLSLLAGMVLLSCAPQSSLPGSGQGVSPAGWRAADATQTAEAYARAAAQATETVTAAQADATAIAATTSQPEPDAPSEASSTMPVIKAFACQPCVIDPGGAAVLRWDAGNANAVLLDGQGVVAPGEKVVQPDQTTSYLLVASNENGRAEKRVTVEVRGLPVVHFFTCLPCQIYPGEQATLSWDLSGGTAAYLDGVGVTAPGSTIVAPLQTTTYRLEAVSEAGSVQRLVTVNVLEKGNPAAVEETLARQGYQVRSLGELKMADGTNTVALMMASVSPSDPYGSEAADQYFWGLAALYDNFAGPPLSVGLYDGQRYLRLVTVPSSAVEDYLRGRIDGVALWQAARFCLWDEWTDQWQTQPAPKFGTKAFAGKEFSY